MLQRITKKIIYQKFKLRELVMLSLLTLDIGECLRINRLRRRGWFLNPFRN